MPGKSKKGGGLETKSTMMMKASPEKKEAAKAKAVAGGMPQNVADKVFKMKSPEVAYMAKVAGSPAMEMGYKDKVMKMDPEKDKIDSNLVKEAVDEFKVRPPQTQGDSISLTNTMRNIGKAPQSVTDSRFRFYEKYGTKGGLLSKEEKIAKVKKETESKRAAILAKRSKRSGQN